MGTAADSVGEHTEISSPGVLNSEEIHTRLESGPLGERLIITPLLEQSQIGVTSVDLRLGFSFVIPRRPNMASIEPMKPEAYAGRERYQERFTLSRGRPLYLHPGQFVLGATLEYVRLPSDLSSFVTSRSSWGRAGLVIATAIAVSPGFAGVITLELANLGEVPLALRPGVRIAQMVFHPARSTSGYGGRYRCPTGPEMGKVHLDKELKFWNLEPGSDDGSASLGSTPPPDSQQR